MTKLRMKKCFKCGESTLYYWKLNLDSCPNCNYDWYRDRELGQSVKEILEK